MKFVQNNFYYLNIKYIIILILYIYFYILNNFIDYKILFKNYQIKKLKYFNIPYDQTNIYKDSLNYIMNIKKVVYSIIIDKYDKPFPFIKQKGFDYFMFSENIINNTNWTLLPIPNYILMMNISNIKKQRFIKTHPHLFFKDYELSLYVDASYNIIGDLNIFLLRLLTPKYDMYYLQHPIRNTIFQEISAVVYFKKESNISVELVKNKYIKEKISDNQGLIESCIIVRKHNNKKIINLMENWWNEIKNFSHRDQLSLNYVISKLNIKIHYISKKYSLEFFNYTDHLIKIKFRS